MVETLNYLRGPKNRPQSTVLLLLMIHTISYLSIHCWFLLTWTNGGRAAGLIVSETTINLEWKEKTRVVGQSILPEYWVSVPFFFVWYSHLSTTSTTIISTTGEWGKHCFFSLSFLDCSCFGLCSSFCICWALKWLSVRSHFLPILARLLLQILRDLLLSVPICSWGWICSANPSKGVRSGIFLFFG